MKGYSGDLDQSFASAIIVLNIDTLCEERQKERWVPVTIHKAILSRFDIDLWF